MPRSVVYSCMPGEYIESVSLRDNGTTLIYCINDKVEMPVALPVSMDFHFEDALIALKQGYHVRRRHWFFRFALALGGSISTPEFIDVFSKESYKPNYRDLLATDWQIVDPPEDYLDALRNRPVPVWLAGETIREFKQDVDFTLALAALKKKSYVKRPFWQPAMSLLYNEDRKETTFVLGREKKPTYPNPGDLLADDWMIFPYDGT